MSEPGSSSRPTSADPGPSAEPEPVGPDDPFSTSPGTESGCRVDLLLEIDDLDPPLAGWLDTELMRVARLAGVTAGRITLVVVGDERIAALDQQYRGEAGPTDVLSFDLRERPDDPVEGDLVLGADEARRQAQRRGHPVRVELLLYAVHGLLHLVGYDDADPDQAERMHRREDELLTQAGYGPVYGGAPRT